MKRILIILAVLALLGGGWFLFRSSDIGLPKESDPASTNTSVDELSTQVETLSTNDRDFLKDANFGEMVDATGQTEVTITINDFVFETTALTINKGTKVTWTNVGNISHNVVSSTNSPDTFLGHEELLGNSDSFDHIFDTAGTFYYFCSPHQDQMRGIIKVVD